MPKIDITTNEQTIIMNALDLSIRSAKRAQNTGKTPEIREVYAKHERTEQALLNKIAEAK